MVAFLQLVPPKIIGIVVDEIDQGTLAAGKLLLWIGLLVGAGLSMYVLRYYWRIMIFGSAVKLARQRESNYLIILQICRNRSIKEKEQGT